MHRHHHRNRFPYGFQYFYNLVTEIRLMETTAIGERVPHDNNVFRAEGSLGKQKCQSPPVIPDDVIIKYQPKADEKGYQWVSPKVKLAHVQRNHCGR